MCYIFIVTKNLNRPRDLLVSAALFLLSFALYIRTLAPTVAFLFDDTLEFQYVVPRLGILHQTGYPFYTLLGKLFTLLVPLNDPAFRLNLLSALGGSLSVAMVFLVARHLTTSRFAALIGALTFAVGQTFWSQAVIAETYTIQMLIVAVLFYLALVWREHVQRGETDAARRRFYALAFAMGLGLTHHRLILLLYPAIAIYVLFVDRNVLRNWKMLARAALLFIAPLLLYLYLPLRGAAGSADGTYENTLSGFVTWVMAQQYTVFLLSNPFQVQHDAAFHWTLFQNQFGIVGLALAALGVVWLVRTPHEWVLLIVALIAQAVFAFNYHVANVEVHFLTTFMLLALFASAGADALLALFSRAATGPSSFAARLSPLALVLLCILLLFIPTNLLIVNYATNDLSTKWDVHDYGLDILSQPLEKNATLIGIQGEMTLLRYFQETQGMRPDVRTLAADDEKKRLEAVANALKENSPVYLTRQLKDLAASYSLSSIGPLIRVQAGPTTNAPQISHPLDEDWGAVKLLGYDLDAARLDPIPNLWHTENGNVLRVTLYWQAIQKMDRDALVSVKVTRGDQHVVGQIDHGPVMDAYPTTAWQVGEIITDTYAVPLMLGITPGDYAVGVTMYDPNSGSILGQRKLAKIALDADVTAPRPNTVNPVHASDEYFALSLAGYAVDTWNIAHTLDADYAGFALAGYSLDIHAPVRPGDALPLTLLWRAGSTKLPDKLLLRMWLEDSEGKIVASRDAPMSIEYPAFLWPPGAYVREWPTARVAANVADGQYDLKLAVARDNKMLGSGLLPFNPTVVDLGRIEIKNRPRTMSAPTIAHPFEATFDNAIKLLGYELTQDVPQRGVRLTLYWKSLAQMNTSYSVFVHLLDGKDTLLASADAMPGGGDLPTTGWIENEYITDAHAFTLPPDLPSGGYPLEIGLYDPATGVRLTATDGKDRVILTSVNLP